MIGTAFSVLIRLELSSPGVQFLQGDHQLFNVIITVHAFIMIFFLLSVSLLFSIGPGLYILPFHCRSLDLAYPRLNNLWTQLLKKGTKLNMETIKNLKQLNFSDIVWYTDRIIFLLFISFAIMDLVRLCFVLADSICVLNYSLADSILQMNSNNNGLPGTDPGFQGNPNNIGGNPIPGGSNGGPTGTHHTQVQIIHDDGS
jgi:hypothetical protein